MKSYFVRAGKTFFWEFIQNYPLLLGFALALEWAKRQEWLLMVVSSLIGSLVGSLIIRFTEPYIIPGEKESAKVTITNMFSFFIVAVLIAIYFAQNWGSWFTDALVGTFIGTAVGYGQDLAAGQKKPGVRHILALSAAFIPALMLVRALTITSPPFIASLLLNSLITLIIVVIDYLTPTHPRVAEIRKSY